VKTMNFDYAAFADALFRRSPPHAVEHLGLVLVPLLLAAAISFPTGILLTRPRYRTHAGRVLALLNLGQTIPPLAVICLFLPFWGLGFRPAVIALTIYALLPIARNTVAGLSGVPWEVREAARGMGMSPREILLKVELPLSLPVVMTGIKTSAVLTVGTAALASLVGARGMGAVIFAGINFRRVELILAGTLVIGVMALALDRLLALVEYLLSPRYYR
jgi:osmoprotectant transport system permease protein